MKNPVGMTCGAHPRGDFESYGFLFGITELPHNDEMEIRVSDGIKLTIAGLLVLTFYDLQATNQSDRRTFTPRVHNRIARGSTKGVFVAARAEDYIDQ
jgi:hypothetical protein